MLYECLIRQKINHRMRENITKYYGIQERRHWAILFVTISFLKYEKGMIVEF